MLGPVSFPINSALPPEDNGLPIRRPIRISKVSLIGKQQMDSAAGRGHCINLPGLSWPAGHQDQLLPIRRPLRQKHFQIVFSQAQPIRAISTARPPEMTARIGPLRPSGCHART